MNRREYSVKVSDLLYNRISVFPRYTIRGDSRFKCTNNWFAGIFGFYAVGEIKGFVGEETRELYGKMEREFRSTKMAGRDTTREDIVKGDQLLWWILKDCSSKT